jgi:hypothetical protein
MKFLWDNVKLDRGMGQIGGNLPIRDDRALKSFGAVAAVLHIYSFYAPFAIIFIVNVLR